MNTANASAAPDGPDRAIIERAAQWCATVHGGEASADDLAACRRWRDAHPDHELAYTRLEALWAGFDRAPYASAVAARRIIADALPRPRRGPRKAGAVLALAAVALAAWAGLRIAPPAWLLADYRSGTGEWRVVELPDHSRVTLGTDSAIDVRYDAERRLVELRQGEILLEVARDGAGRPFVVHTRDGSAEALGTRYVVRLERDHTDVSVTESTVRACASAPPAPCARLAAGQRARLSAEGLAPLPDIDPETAEDWARKSLVVEGRPLPDVLAELARYRPGRLAYDARALAGLRVSGVFPLDDTDRALQALAASLPLRIERRTSWWVSVELR